MNALTEQLSKDVARLTRQNERLALALEDMLAQASGLPKSCGHEFHCVCPYESARKALEEAKEKP